MMFHCAVAALSPLAYVGPETLLPLASALAAIFGAILFMWRWIVGLPGRIFGRSRKDPQAQDDSASGPASPESAHAGEPTSPAPLESATQDGGYVEPGPGPHAS